MSSVRTGARPRRSALYMPASNPRAIEKAKGLPCDVIMLDLEDSVSPETKLAAREAAIAAVRSGGFGPREVAIRVNALDTPWGADDLAAVSSVCPDAVLVPKIGSAADVVAASLALSAAPQATRLWVMIETCQAILAISEIASAAHETRLSAFVMGINDLAKEMGARMTSDRAPFRAALSLTVTAARAAGLTALDGVHNEIEDLAALEEVCAQGRDFGFDGKSLIHPSHLEICNRIFSPDPADVLWARAVITAFDAPENTGKGALRVEGRLAERLHYDQAVRLVAMAEAIEATG